MEKSLFNISEETAGKKPAKRKESMKTTDIAPYPFKAGISDNARKVLEKRYLKKDLNGKAIEVVEDMFWRVATNIAEAEKRFNNAGAFDEAAREFYGIIGALGFLP